MDDAHLIHAHLRGDPQALSDLMARHREPLMGFLRARVGEDAEDLYQETWSRAAHALPRYAEQDAFRAWLFQIARRLIIDHRRRRGARIQAVPQEEPPAPILRDTPLHDLSARRLAQATQAAVEALHPDVAAVVRLRLVDDRAFKDIAHDLGIPLNTALGRMHRGLKQIRRALEAEGLLSPRET